MGRDWKRKTLCHGTTSATVMKAAVAEVLSGRSIRDVAQQFDVKRSTLQRYVQKKKVSTEEGTHEVDDSNRYEPNYRAAQIFSEKQEIMIAEYLMLASKMNYGLTPTEAMKLAYEFAEVNHISVPAKWEETKKAGIEWFRNFMKRNKSLSIRSPEATSLSRATSFNKKNVDEFFKNLESVFLKNNFGPQNIYNVDETGLTTVQKPSKVISQKGAKQVSQMTSGERGSLVTVCSGINAVGNDIPPFFVFPRVHFKDMMIKGAPPGSNGTAQPSGWMNSECFCEYLKHFAKFSHCSKEQPVLIILDNHESHISIEGLSFAKENGIVLLTLPPHCSHKLQPLDRSVFGPFKKFYYQGCDSWMLRYPGKPITIYDISEIAGYAYPLAFSKTNMISGFAVTGIWPLNPNIFSADEFLSSSVTDRSFQNIEAESNNMEPLAVNPESVQTDPEPQKDSEPAIETGVTMPTTVSDQQEMSHIHDQVQISSTVSSTPGPSCALVSQTITPEQVRPFPKAGPRKSINRKRKGKTSILTDTPVKDKIISELLMRKKVKKGKSEAVGDVGLRTKNCRKKLENMMSETASKKGKQKEKESLVKKAKRRQKQKLAEESSSDSDSDSCVCLVCLDSYANSASGEKWIQCTSCRFWAHEQCTDGGAFYVCQNCYSD